MRSSSCEFPAHAVQESRNPRAFVCGGGEHAGGRPVPGGGRRVDRGCSAVGPSRLRLRARTTDRRCASAAPSHRSATARPARRRCAGRDDRRPPRGPRQAAGAHCRQAPSAAGDRSGRQDAARLTSLARPAAEMAALASDRRYRRQQRHELSDVVTPSRSPNRPRTSSLGTRTSSPGNLAGHAVDDLSGPRREVGPSRIPGGVGKCAPHDGMRGAIPMDRVPSGTRCSDEGHTMVARINAAVTPAPVRACVTVPRRPSSTAMTRVIPW